MSERHWTLMTKTRSGVVSILKDLTLEECRQAYVLLNPERGHTWVSYEGENGGNYGGSPRMGSKDEIELREVFGPPGWDKTEIRAWDEWPKYLTIKLGDPRHPSSSTVRESRGEPIEGYRTGDTP